MTGLRATFAAVVAVLIALVVATCSPAQPSPAPPSQALPSPVLSSPARPSPTASSPAPGATARASEAPHTPGSSAVGVGNDPALLAILPPEIDGVPVVAEPEAFEEAMTDPAFAANVEDAVFPVVVAERDLASGVVARLRPGTFSEAFFRDWRDSYDEGACGQAGGVVGNAAAELGGRPVHITSCAEGLLVYHAWLPEREVLVSLLSLGERRFGELLMGDLRP
jgi:hypothetical protein